jgi:hypothetical protein
MLLYFLAKKSRDQILSCTILNAPGMLLYFLYQFCKWLVLILKIYATVEDRIVVYFSVADPGCLSRIPDPGS